MNSKIVFISLACILIVSCAPNKFAPATFTAISPPTLVPSPTEMPIATATIQSKVEVETEKVVDSFRDFFTFDDFKNIDGLPAIKGKSLSGFSTLILIGRPQLAKTILIIELGLEYQDSANNYQINLLRLTTPNATEAIEWIRANYREAALEGQIPEHDFGNAKVILKVDNGVNPYFLLTVIPIDNAPDSP